MRRTAPCPAIAAIALALCLACGNSRTASSGVALAVAKGAYPPAAAESQPPPPDREWRTLSGELAGMISAVAVRLDAIEEEKRLPAGLTARDVAGVRERADAVEAGWVEALEQARSGDLVRACGRARGLEPDAKALMKRLGLPGGSARL